MMNQLSITHSWATNKAPEQRLSINTDFAGFEPEDVVCLPLAVFLQLMPKLRMGKVPVLVSKNINETQYCESIIAMQKDTAAAPTREIQKRSTTHFSLP